MTETPKQYSARRLRVKIERAKAAIMEAQQELADEGFALNPNEYQELLSSAFRRLDSAWAKASFAGRDRRLLDVEYTTSTDHRPTY